MLLNIDTTPCVYCCFPCYCEECKQEFAAQYDTVIARVEADLKNYRKNGQHLQVEKLEECLSAIMAEKSEIMNLEITPIAV